MAKAIITIEDVEGGVNLAVDFGQQGLVKHSHAHGQANLFIHILNEHADSATPTDAGGAEILEQATAGQTEDEESHWVT